MNKRQQELLELLKIYKLTHKGEWLSTDEICVALSREYPRHEEYSSKHNSTVLGWMRKDVQELNNNDEVDVIILSSNKGYRLAVTIEETEDYLRKEHQACIRRLARWSKKLKKARANGQVTIDFEKETLREIRTFESEE